MNICKDNILVKKWRLQRSIIDNASDGTNYTAKGIVYLYLLDENSHEKEYKIVETGVISTVNDNKNEFTSTYYAKWNSKKNILKILRDDYSDFLEFDNFLPLAKQLSGDHLCSKDMYKGLIEFVDNTIKVTWDVLGPKKNYQMITIYDEAIK